MSKADHDAREIDLPIKRTDGETLEERMTANAYHNILPARYLKKDSGGELVETQVDLFERVAKNIALAESVFEANRRGVEVLVRPDQVKPDHPRRNGLVAEVFGEGVTVGDDDTVPLTEENVNKFAFETVVPELPDEISGHVEEQAGEFQEMMEKLSVIPNSPTLMNAGDELQQLSACFVMSPDDDISDIHETAKEAAEVFQCLTADTRVHTKEHGLTSIANVESGDHIRQGDSGAHRYGRVQDTHEYDNAPVYRIQLEPGVELSGTPNHRLLVNGEWQEIEDIEAGDTIDLEIGWLPVHTAEVELEQVARGPQWADQRSVANQEIVALHSEGLNDYEIADQLDSSSSTVQRRRANELKLPPNGSGGRPKGRYFDENAFYELYEQGLTDRQIAGEVDASPSAVRSFRVASDLEPNGQPVKTVTQPDVLDPNLAALVGLWIGDGSKHEDGIRFHLEREELVEEVDRLSHILFDTGTSRTWAEGCYEVTINSHEIKRFWLKNFGAGKVEASSAFVPEPIRQAGRMEIAAFLRGLFSSDGSLNESLYPTLYSASERLIDEVHQLLLGLGIPTTKWSWDNEDRDYYTVRVTDKKGLQQFEQFIGFMDERRFEMAERLREVNVGRTTTGKINGWSWSTSVESVTQVSEETVYDVTVEGDHSYHANSMVSHNSGGGVGYAFWLLRPYGDSVGSTGGIASGPITFMRTFDQLCETIAQGGTRRGAQMAIMRVSHPDVIEFIHAKNKDVSLAQCLKLNDPDDYTYTSFSEALEEARKLIDEDGRVPKHLRNAVEAHLSNFNISVGVTDGFMEALENGEAYTFTNPRTEEPHIATAETKEMYSRYGLGEYVDVGEALSIPAEIIWERIIEGAHENGEPGVVFLERINKQHSFDVEEQPDHRILATNPCITGEMRVQLADGTSREIEELAAAGGQIEVKTLENGEIAVRKATAFKTKENAPVLCLETESGGTLRATPDHKIRTADNCWVAAAELEAGDEIVGLSGVLATPQGPVQETTVETVASIENNGKEAVFDLHVTDTHNFFASASGDNNVNIHNCGEQPLEEYEACNLGHINLSTLAARDAPDWRVWSEEHGTHFDSEADAIGAFLEEAIDWDEFDDRIEKGTRFLENVVTMSDFPVDEITDTVRSMRKIGLGIMGLAQLYIQLGIKYGSDPANEVARQVMTHINHRSKWASHELAKERESFGEWENSKYADPVRYREWFEHQTGLDAGDWSDGFAIRNHNSTTIAPTGCVEENSLISTDEGLRPIKHLDETEAEFQQWDEIDVGVATDGGTKVASAIYDNGFDRVKQLQTNEGFSVAATFGHRFRTITDEGDYAWKRADEFTPGDPIVLQRDSITGGEPVQLDTSERLNSHHNTAQELTLPERMTPELAEFLGYYMGDGYVHKNVGVKLVVESEAEELDSHLRKLGESLFGVTPAVEDKDSRHILSFGGRHLPRYFGHNGWLKETGNTGEGAASAFIPDQVLRSDEACLKAFIRGIFEADGTAPRKVELSTVSETLAKDLQTALLSLGIVFVRDSLNSKQLGDDHFGDRTRHLLRGANRREDQRFMEEIGFITKSVEFEMTPQSYRNDTYPPSTVEQIREVDGYSAVDRSTKRRVNQSPINGAVARKLVRDVEEQSGSTVRLNGRPLNQFYVATIDSVEDEMAYTKDITVPENNTYVANGFVTHNTTGMVGNTTGGCEPIYNVAYYKNVSDDVQGDEMLVEFDDYFLRVLEANDIDVAAVKEEAQEQMAHNEFDGIVGLDRVPDAIAELFVTTSDVSTKEHASVQCACQAGVDSAISKCLEEGTLVQTDDGPRPIESFADVEQEPDTFTEVEEDITIDGVPVTSQYYAGETAATRVRVDNGAEITGATESHKVLTPDGWQCLGELEVGDYVIGRHLASHGDGGRLVDFDRGQEPLPDGGAALTRGGQTRSPHEHIVDVPRRMSSELALFLGMYAADGTAIDSTYRIGITTASERIRDIAANLIESLFGVGPRIREDERGGETRKTVYGVGINSKRVWEFVTDLCSSGAYDKRVPEAVLRGSPEEKIAFVDGITLDGYVTSQSLVVYEGMSKDLATGVAELLRSFGKSKVYMGRKWVDPSEAYAYAVHVTNKAQDLVSPLEPHKQVERFDQRHRVYVPPSSVDKTEFDSRSTPYFAARNFEYRGRNYMFHDTAESLGIDDAPPLYRVTEVEDVGTREMYDIELAGPHEYIVGGVVSHNTVNAPNDATPEDAREVFEFIYENGGKGVTYYRDGTRSKQVLTTRADNAEFAVMDEEDAASALVEQIEDIFGGIDAFTQHEAVRERVNEELEDLTAAAIDPETGYARVRARPNVLSGVTQRIDTGYGKLYVNINEDEHGRPFELFATIGNSGGFTNSFTEALAKTISTALRAGVDPQEIADELTGIRSPKVAWDKGQQINSVPDAIGTALQRYLAGEVDPAYPQQQHLTELEEDAGNAELAPESNGGAAARESEDATQALVEAGENPECPDCGELTLQFKEGCKTCNTCGWSEC